MAEFIYQFLPGDRPQLATEPDSWTDADEAIAAEHYRYLEKAALDGVLILAGRAQDGIGPAIVIIEVETAEEAQRFMERDPFVASRMFDARIHPYRVALSRSEV